MFVEHIGIEVAQLVEQNLILFLYVIGVARHHKKQQRVAFYMAKEAQSESFSFACALDNTRYIGHDKRLIVVVAYYS